MLLLPSLLFRRAVTPVAVLLAPVVLNKTAAAPKAVFWSAVLKSSAPAPVAVLKEDTGTITQYTPGSAIVLKETNGPVHYRFGKTVTYVTRSGQVLDQNAVRTRIKVGVPVRVHYVGTGQNRVVDRVILEKD